MVFVTKVVNPVAFVLVALIATLIPDIDSGFSLLGNNIFSRILQNFSKHRGFIHSLTLGFIISFIMALIAPTLAFGFFLGYSIHIFVDGFTVEGVTPFWPYKQETKGLIRTGSRIETILFTIFIVLDLLMIYLILV